MKFYDVTNCLTVSVVYDTIRLEYSLFQVIWLFIFQSPYAIFWRNKVWSGVVFEIQIYVVVWLELKAEDMLEGVHKQKQHEM